MEPQTPPIQTPQPIVEPIKKCQHLPTIIILIILMVGGFGFGGFELWQNIQEDNEIKNLQAENIKIKDMEQELQAQIDEYKKDLTSIEGSPILEEIKPENIKMAIDNSGELLVFDMPTGKILANANQSELNMFISCDSGTLESRKVNPVIICTVEKNNKEQIKFIYNYQTNELTYN